MVSAGLAFWGLIFILSARMLPYFQSVEVIGDLLAHHLLAMILLTFFTLLIFSHIISALSNLYLSADLELCHSSPSSMDALFLSRVFHTIIDSSWMVFVFGLPIMMAYAYVFRPGPGFYLDLVHMGPALAIIAACIGIFVTMVMVSIFPAQSTRDIMMLLVIIGVVVLYLLLRLLRPERLVDPDAFFNMMQYITALKSPDSPYLPTHWVTQVLWGHLSQAQGKGRFFEILLLWSTAGAFVFLDVWVARYIYFTGFSKSQEAKRRRRGRGLLDVFARMIQKPFGHDLASITDKDIRTFFRDNTQWSQLLLLGALAVVYLYNFSVLPLEKSPIRLEFLQNEIAFLNMALAAFVLSAVSVRFIFPAVSSEGGAFWIIKSSPIPIKRFLWGKFILYILPMLLLAEVLIIVTNMLLHVTPFMMVLSSVTMFFAVFGIVALGVGFGALYPRFKYENISQVATGYGGLMYMIFCAMFMAIIIVLEAGPVYILFMADLKQRSITALQWLFVVPSFLAVFFVQWIALFTPMRMGVRALEAYE
jgi:ABC-2 type transport system permease protein